MKISNSFADWLSKSGLVGFLFYFLITFIFKVPLYVEVLIPVVLVFMVGGAYFITQSKMNTWRALRQNMITGSWEKYVPCPSPSSSMLNAMLEKGVPPTEISALYFQTWELKNNYFEKQLKENLGQLGILGRVKLMFRGFGSDEDAEKIREIFPEAEVLFSQERLSEHVNLITLKNGDIYVWYEPVHKTHGDSDQVYRPEDGAFLIKSDNPEAIMRYYKSGNTVH